MKGFIEVHTIGASGGPVLIAVAHIQSVRRDEKGNSLVVVRGNGIRLNEDYQRVRRLIEVSMGEK